MINGSPPGPYPTLGFNTYDTSYQAGVAGYGGIFQFQNGNGSLTYYTGPNVAAGQIHTNTQRFTMSAAGNVGIGTINPDQKLSVNGGASKPGGGSWDVFSDERLKNIRGRFTGGLKAVMQLQPLRYEYKRDNTLGIDSPGEHIGFSAQAVQKIIPEAVSKNDKGYLLINNDPIIWTMLNAIKQQQDQIEALRTANTALNARLRSVENVLRKRGVGSSRRRH